MQFQDITGIIASTDWIEVAGYVASALVFLTFCMKTLIPLRIMAIVSNIAFILYGIGADLKPILLLHAALLPLNVLRTYQQVQLFRRVRETMHGRVEVSALIPFMQPLHRSAGAQLFSKGDLSDRIYFINRGEVIIPEIGKVLGAGTLFGEIGLFTPDRLRTASARCVTDCQLQAIGDGDIRRLCLRDPAFGLYMTRLIAERMAENQSRTEAAT